MTRAAAITLALLLGCVDPIEAYDAGPHSVDLGPCARLSGTLTDAGPMANVVVYPDGHPCESGTCQQGECVP